VQVEQVTMTEEPELVATNGKMLHLLTRPVADRGADYKVLEATAGDESRPMWQRVLGHVERLGVQALIDAGGLLAGVTNRNAALHLLKILDPARWGG
jgi:hypothetical protein